MDKEIFKGLKVIELSTVLAGPMVGTFFSELGAEVIKFEPRKGFGDVTRSWKLPSEDPNNPVSAYFASANYGKEYRKLDLNDTEDLTMLKKALSQADILLSNFRSGKLESIGLDDHKLKSAYPRLIHGKINGFGPESDRPAFDVVLQAESGFMLMNGAPQSEPVKMPVALIDLLAAHQLKEGLLVALLQRTHSGQGAIVEVSLLDAAIASLANQATNWLMANHIPQAMGSLHPNIAPYGELMKSKDGKWMVLAAGNDRQFADLCNVLGLHELPIHPNYSTNPARVKNREALAALFRPVFLTKDRSVWMKELKEKGVPVGALLNMKEVFEEESGRKMILQELIGQVKTKRPQTVAFHIK